MERKVGECNQWNAFGQCSKGDSCSFSHDLASGNRCDQRRGGQSTSLAPKAQAQTDGKIPQKVQAAEGKFLPAQEARFRADISLRESVRTRRVIIGTLSCVSKTSLNQDAHMAKHADSDTWRLMGSPAKSRRKVVQLPY